MYTNKPDHGERSAVKNGHSMALIQRTRTYTSDLFSAGTVDCCAPGTANYDDILDRERWPSYFNDSIFNKSD